MAAARPEHRPVIVVAGPTACGKSALALDIAGEFDGILINADSMQIYRELPIITAAPGAAALARAPHRLYGVLPAADSCSVGRWRALARQEIDDAHDHGRLPIVVGGTGLYLRALMRGLARIPPVPPDVRAATRQRLEADGPEALHRALAARDPAMADRLSPRDGQRLARAWEVLEATGRSLADWQRPAADDGPGEGLAFLTLLLLPPREAIYEACNIRFASMLANGALEEAGRLLAQQLDPALPAMKAVGLREVLRHLSGEISLDEACRAGQQATRRYAKRQLTWFRHQMAPDYTSGEQYSERLTPEIFPYISKFLLT
ncbi:MAG: tRNA (adenosine(37)-N6)-dimethylallyltransferase MiaA [Alphaproteobacteria bacterium]